MTASTDAGDTRVHDGVTPSGSKPSGVTFYDGGELVDSDDDVLPLHVGNLVTYLVAANREQGLDSPVRSPPPDHVGQRVTVILNLSSDYGGFYLSAPTVGSSSLHTVCFRLASGAVVYDARDNTAVNITNGFLIELVAHRPGAWLVVSITASNAELTARSTH